MLALKQFCGLLLWIFFLTFAQYVKGCTLDGFRQSALFDENFDLSNLRASYSGGERVRVPCKVGFRGFYKILCASDGQWHSTSERCRGISCGHPGDVQFADFRLVKGSDYDFGSQVLYTCHRGYQMTSYVSTRNCLQDGWDGHLPECEPISCPSLPVDRNVLINGDMDQPQSGSVIQFSCSSRDDVLEGPTQIVCDEYGNWDNNKPPKCKEISCPKPPLVNFVVEGEKLVYKKNEFLRYNCNSGYKKTDGRAPKCEKVGQSAQWTPMPQCELITCKLSPDPPQGTTYRPLNQIIFKPTQTVTVSCGEKQWVKSKELQSAELTCQGTGDWDYDPVCQLVTCSRNAENVYDWERNWYGPNTVYIDQTLWYRCYQDYEPRSPTGRAMCTRRGWEPNPLCKERRCPKPSYSNAEITDHYEKVKYEHNERVHFRCTYDPRTTFYVDCYRGNWRDSPRPCKEKPCTPPPPIKNGEMVDRAKGEYNHLESVRFRCNGQTDTFSVTCESGKWKQPKSCEDVPCTTPNIPNAEMVGQPLRSYRHNRTVQIRCTTGSMEASTVSCQSGKWIPENPCPEKSVCEGAVIPNGFSHELQNKLYYTCDDGFKLLTKGWWGEASCEGGKWKTSECVDRTDCGPVPDIPHMIGKSEIPRFSDGETFPIQCETGHRNLHTNLTELTCTEGKWTSKDVPFKLICTPIANKCNPPPKRLNAVVMAPFEKEYSSGTRLTYKCRENYTMTGDGTIRCNNGTWEQKNISCKRRSIESTVMPESDGPTTA